MRHSLVTRTKLLLLAVFAFAGVFNTAQASLSTKAATPSQLGALSAAANKQTEAQKVLQVYRQWAGTRYRIGGTTKAGIDCSAFVKTIMNNAFNLHLPRSTAEQKHIGKSIKKSELKAGDLVFFRKNHHVGIYIGNGKFVHASTSQGVITSSLSDRYWARTYTQSRRVL